MINIILWLILSSAFIWGTYMIICIADKKHVWCPRCKKWKFRTHSFYNFRDGCKPNPIPFIEFR